MTTPFHKYLVKVLEECRLKQNELDKLNNIFNDIIQKHLQPIHQHKPTIYKGGSCAKRTLTKPSYDLDIVIYFPKTIKNSVEEIYNYVLDTLKKGHKIKAYGVAIQFEYKGIDIDVVPGKCIDDNFANLYNSKDDKKVRTSLKEHIGNVKDVRSMIKLMKIWRLNHSLNWHKLAMEQTVVKALENKSKNDFGICFETILLYIKSNILNVKFIDPANSNNPINVSSKERQKIQNTAIKCYKLLKEGLYKNIIKS